MWPTFRVFMIVIIYEYTVRDSLRQIKDCKYKRSINIECLRLFSIQKEGKCRHKLPSFIVKECMKM